MKTYDIHMREQDLSLCGKFKDAVLGYGMDGVAEGYPSSVYLSTGDAVFEFGVTQHDLEDYFECFGLNVTQCENARDKITEKLDWKEGVNEVAVLIRSEGIFSVDQNTSSQSIGVPKNIQRVLVDNQSYAKPLAVCNVACGIKIKSSLTNQLMIYADTFPFNMCIVFGSEKITSELSYFTEIPLEKYIRSIGR